MGSSRFQVTCQVHPRVFSLPVKTLQSRTPRIARSVRTSGLLVVSPAHVEIGPVRTSGGAETLQSRTPRIARSVRTSVLLAVSPAHAEIGPVRPHTGDWASGGRDCANLERCA